MAMEALKPSDWFKEKLQQWQQDLTKWHVRHVEYKDPGKKAVLGTTMSKSSAPPPGVAPKATGPGPIPDKPPGKDEDKSQDDAKKSEDDSIEDILRKMEEQAEREDTDVFDMENVCEGVANIPLFSDFAFEDWALLSLRFELHLLCHAVKRDSKDPKLTGIPPEKLADIYAKYYTKSLTPKNYGVESVADIVELVKDTAITGLRSKVVEPMVMDDPGTNDIFVKLTEESRRDRKRRIDIEGDGAALKFPRPTQPTPTQPTTVGAMPKSGDLGQAVSPSGMGVVVPPSGMSKAGVPPAKRPPPPGMMSGMRPPGPSGGMGSMPPAGMGSMPPLPGMGSMGGSAMGSLAPLPGMPPAGGGSAGPPVGAGSAVAPKVGFSKAGPPPAFSKMGPPQGQPMPTVIAPHLAPPSKGMPPGGPMPGPMPGIQSVQRPQFMPGKGGGTSDVTQGDAGWGPQQASKGDASWSQQQGGKGDASWSQQQQGGKGDASWSADASKSDASWSAAASWSQQQGGGGSKGDSAWSQPQQGGGAWSQPQPQQGGGWSQPQQNGGNGWSQPQQNDGAKSDTAWSQPQQNGNGKGDTSWSQPQLSLIHI